VNNRRDFVSFDHVFDKNPVAYITIFADHPLATYARKAIKHSRVAVGKIVKNDWIIARFSKCNVCMASDIASSSCKKNIH
jgi:hypothetical protein